MKNEKFQIGLFIEKRGRGDFFCTKKRRQKVFLYDVFWNSERKKKCGIIDSLFAPFIDLYTMTLYIHCSMYGTLSHLSE
jgi:hypothetical protein